MRTIWVGSHSVFWTDLTRNIMVTGKEHGVQTDSSHLLTLTDLHNESVNDCVLPHCPGPRTAEYSGC